MDGKTAQRLVELNKEFYACYGEQFSKTRQGNWPGWLKFADLIEEQGMMRFGEGEALRVLDAACGNLRFERFLSQRFCESPIEVLALDASDTMPRLSAGQGVKVEYRVWDLIAPLLGESGGIARFDMKTGEKRVSEPIAQGAFDLAVSFGFLHHVPGFERRVSFLSDLVRAVVPHGMCAVSLWRFMDSPSLAQKALESHRRALSGGLKWLQEADLEQGDWILGWQGDPGACRYCHHFCDQEIDELIMSVRAQTGVDQVLRYRDDGRAPGLNEYLVFVR